MPLLIPLRAVLKSNNWDLFSKARIDKKARSVYKKSDVHGHLIHIFDRYHYIRFHSLTAVLSHLF